MIKVYGSEYGLCVYSEDDKPLRFFQYGDDQLHLMQFCMDYNKMEYCGPIDEDKRERDFC